MVARRGTLEAAAVQERVTAALLATGDGTAFVFVRHPDFARQEVAAILRKRWPTAAVLEVGALEPSWRMSTEDAAELARVRRGVEPLRIVVLPQQAADAVAPHLIGVNAAPMAVEPMPIHF